MLRRVIIDSFEKNTVQKAWNKDWPLLSNKFQSNGQRHSIAVWLISHSLSHATSYSVLMSVNESVSNSVINCRKINILNFPVIRWREPTWRVMGNEHKPLLIRESWILTPRSELISKFHWLVKLGLVNLSAGDPNKEMNHCKIMGLKACLIDCWLAWLTLGLVERRGFCDEADTSERTVGSLFVGRTIRTTASIALNYTQREREQ